MANSEKLVKDQIEYYRARAAEYDEWFYRTGRYDRGEAHRQQWNAEVEIVRSALLAAEPRGKVLELACGTGLWTELLITNADALVAVDASPEMLEICKGRVGDKRLHCVEADIFNWKPNERFDFVFFSFWLSHVPQERFADFWIVVESRLAPGGKVFFLDSLFTQDSTARDHDALRHSGTASRKINDGREYEIVKVFYEPHKLQEDLEQRGWRGRVLTTPQFFLYACLERSQ